jgi:threonyl-tRNA synthetase
VVRLNEFARSFNRFFDLKQKFDKVTDMESNKKLISMRHSLAHIMASAIQKLWPEARFGIGPVIDDGFYYDLTIPNYSLVEMDFKKITQEMQRLIKEDLPFEEYELPIDQAIAWAKQVKQPYKLELLNDLKRSGTTLLKDLTSEEIGSVAIGDSKVNSVSFYKCGDFIDLCRGPHVASTGKVGRYKLLRVSGAYWRGDVSKAQLQRVYAVAFNTEQEVGSYLKGLDEAKARDHRKLGQELDLFTMSDLIGPGLPLFTPRGTILRQQLVAFSEQLQKEAGYEAVWTPHLTRIELYKQSGHYDKYPERFNASSVESDDLFMLKPMNCPHVTQIYASRPRSYKDLPQRYMETTTMYRDEKSGELHGLSRVRSLTQDDSHAFVRPDQIEGEFKSIIDMVKQMYLVLDMPLSVDLSFRDDSDRYFGDKKLWNDAESMIEKIAKEEELDYQIVRGEAAFYGPKIDIYIKDALGRKWQCATIQLDYVQPERFNLVYTDKDGTLKRPAMIHKAILGSIERFLSVYIEHTAGKFPIWLAPEQIRIITLNQEDNILDFAYSLKEKGSKLGLRMTIDSDNESVGKKIRRSEIMKVPYTVVVGPKEMESNKVIPRIRADMSIHDILEPLSCDDFLKTVANETKSRVSKSSI